MPNTITQAAMTISGDRQTGKTYMALLYAVTEAHLKKRVLWQSQGGEYAAYQLKEARDLATMLGLPWSRMSNVNGRYALKFESGGYIHFRPPNRTAILDQYDLHILDDADYWRGEPLPNVERVVKTTVTNDDMDDKPAHAVIQKGGHLYYFAAEDISEIPEGLQIRPRGVGAGTPDRSNDFKVFMS